MAGERRFQIGEVQVQRPRGRRAPSLFEEQQRGQCRWSEIGVESGRS